MKRNYYGAYNAYGTNVVLNENNVPIVYVFASKRERDEWVDNDPCIDGNYHCEPITAKEAKKFMRYGCHIVL